MKLKCIGGFCDGKLIEVPNATQRCYDTVSAPIDTTFNVDADLGAVTANMTSSAPHAIYKICKLNRINAHGQKLELYYLCPQNWDEWEAILHLFRSH